MELGSIPGNAIWLLYGYFVLLLAHLLRARGLGSMAQDNERIATYITTINRPVAVYINHYYRTSTTSIHLQVLHFSDMIRKYVFDLPTFFILRTSKMLSRMK